MQKLTYYNLCIIWKKNKNSEEKDFYQKCYVIPFVKKKNNNLKFLNNTFGY